MITDLDIHHQSTKINLYWFCERMNLFKKRVVQIDEVVEWIEENKLNVFEPNPSTPDEIVTEINIPSSQFLEENMEQEDWVRFVRDKYYSL